MALYNCAGGNGGGGGGTSDYAQLSNLPQINNTTLIGNKSAADLGLVGAVSGKGLSSNDYTNADKAIVDGVTSALAGKVDTSLVGSANGVAELDANGRVPSSQLPSYVDDVLEYADLAHFPATGETGKIYIAEDTNKTYRWSGSNYAEISESLALGETSSTAYAGNKGKANADAIAGIKNGTSINSFGAVETALANKANSSDLGDKSNLTTTDKSSCVGAINEVNGLVNNVNYINLTFTSTETTAIGKLRDIVNEFLPDVKVYTNIINVKNSNGDKPYATVIYSGNGGDPKLYGMGIAISYYLDHAYLITNANGTVTIKQLSEAN